MKVFISSLPQFQEYLLYPSGIFPVYIHVIYLIVSLLLEILLSQKFMNFFLIIKIVISVPGLKKEIRTVYIYNKRCKSPSLLPHTTSLIPPRSLALLFFRGRNVHSILKIPLYFCRMLCWSLNLKV